MMRVAARLALAAGLVALESYVFLRYREFGAQFHYLLHGFVGAAAGLALLVSARLTGHGAGVAPWVAAAIGRLISALPDVLFLTVEVPHQRWMDVFVAHIAVHLVPSAVTWTLVLFSLSVFATTALLLGHRVAAAGGVCLTMVLAVGGLVLREPIPRTLEELRSRPQLTCVIPALAAGSAPVAAPILVAPPPGWWNR